MGNILIINLHMFLKLMVAYVDVLGSRAKLGRPFQVEGAKVVFKKPCNTRRAWYKEP
jgi:hypothetical protein